ncbi:MAG: haloacid dehalogenase-like hydrolase [Gemmatimonadota bacterium]
MRTLVLFDIDGTLVRGGPAKDAFRNALLRVYGTTGPIETHSFAGKTDPQIARELMVGAGIDEQDVDRGLPSLWEDYLDGLEAGLIGRPMDLLAGARELVARLSQDPEVALGLVTGNVERGAFLKLRSVALDTHFTVGGYGSDHEHRNELPAIAVERARRQWGRAFGPDAVVVVGDTPRDVECGRWFGARTVAVSTGNFTAEELASSGADAVLESFADIETSSRAVVGR